MDNIFKLIDERIKKYLKQANLLKIKSAKVVEISDTYIKVQIIGENSFLNTVNFCGASLHIDDSVKVCYTGSFPTSSNSFIIGVKK